MASDDPSEQPFNGIWINGQRVHVNRPPAVPNQRREWVAPQLNASVFTGPKLKIKRAKQHIAELEASLEAFHETSPYELVCDQDPKTGENVYRVRIHKPIPCELPTIIGDIVHNLRSCLDHLVCDLVRANKDQVRRGTGFPISGTKKRFETNAIGKIQGVSPQSRRFIERLKPYKGGNTPLWMLHELDALDKHHGIIPVAVANVQILAKWAMPFMGIGPDGSLRIGGPGPDGQPFWTGAGIPDDAPALVYPLKDNAEVYRSPPTGMHEEVNASISVAFNKSEIAEGQPVIETLKQLEVFVERTLAIMEMRLL